MSNFLKPESIGKKMADVKSAISYLLPELEETVRILHEEDVKALTADSKESDAVVANRVREMLNKKSRSDELIRLMKEVLNPVGND